MEKAIIIVLSLLIFLGGIAYWKIMKTLDGYATEKGKNLANKEDIEELTLLVQNVMQQNAVLLEDHKAKNQMRMAALDRRLQAHQEAYKLWRQLYSLVALSRNVNLPEKISESWAWWDENCLYLDQGSRGPFFNALIAAQNMGDIHATRLTGGGKGFIEELQVFKRGGEMIVRGAALPSLAEEQELIEPVWDGTAPIRKRSSSASTCIVDTSQANRPSTAAGKCRAC